MKRTPSLLLALLAAASLAALPAHAADPSLHEVYQAANTGNLKQAQSMMDQVLHDHPNSAKTHYVEAELLARQGKAYEARAELGQAERLAPGLPFAKPEAVQALRQQLAPPARAAAAQPDFSRAATPMESPFPWGMVLIGLGLFAAVLFFFRSLTRRPQVVPAGAGYAAPGGGFGTGYAQPMGAGPMGPVGPAGGMGSGILGSLATGAAVGAGIVAGEALMHKVFDGSGSSGGSSAAAPASFQPIDDTPALGGNYDMGGNDFGVSDGGGWDDGGGSAGGDDW